MYVSVWFQIYGTISNWPVRGISYLTGQESVRFSPKK